ncbi:uncharacterized protein F5891DRAFT_1189467 [Suillus fuscotomentosus]|uniref:Uncharacterized protein n=1 Tax=Suillus fuscotomentosus TaxID=1912939 RepID=A0AAD4E5I1_9AGAM|nr:uncharacterized protein F5891DRAFT_1189467 [Suillus fuscotomentosus]KAG1899656.1 hypothetical protein F5891DRAFT_1189467 [Suillus fuscotomentosus]
MFTDTDGIVDLLPHNKNPLAKLAERKRESTVPNPAVTQYIEEWKIVANGSSANFRIYWSGLMKEKQLDYDPDALKLVKDNIWNGNAVDIISKISSGSLY